MEKITNILGLENFKTALETSESLVRGRSQILSEELLMSIFPLPYSSAEDAHHEMATSLLQQILFPYL